MKQDWLHFVTGRLASDALQQVVRRLSAELGFAYSIDVMPITVAGLMTPAWVARHLTVPTRATQIVLPGYCDGDLAPLTEVTHCPITIGPKDLHELPQFLGASQGSLGEEYGEYAIQIIAEINHAPKLSREEIHRHALALREAGADFIDLGCVPGETWSGVGECVRSLVDLGLAISIDSLNIDEISAATQAGASLVLSVNGTNREPAADWGCEVVAIPDEPSDLRSLEATMKTLDSASVPYRIDPIIEPIGFGFAQSLQRFMHCRQAFPEAEMMMGIGNLTELTDCDSAGINLILLAICEELQIRSVLTTQVINWARTSVSECDAARRLVHHAVVQRRLPKHVDPRLLMLRDTRLFEQGDDQLHRLAEKIRDHNFRIYAERDQIHLITKDCMLSNQNPFAILNSLEAICQQGDLPPLSNSHAFYLGYEMCKATIANQLGKQYRQDETLNWGLLTRAKEFYEKDRT